MALGAMLLDNVAMKINKIIIRNLFNRYNYELDLINNNKTSVIYGYNGFGKTTILKLITAILNFDYESLEKIIFDKVIIVFSNLDVSKELTVINVNSDNIKYRYIYDEEKYDVKLQKIETISNRTGKKIIVKNYIDNSNLKNIFNKDMIQSAYYISADRVYRNYDSNLGIKNSLKKCIDNTSKKLSSTIYEIDNTIRSQFSNGYLYDYQPSIEELLKTSKMMWMLSKNGWINEFLVSETNIELCDRICSKTSAEITEREKTFLKKWYFRCLSYLNNPKFKKVEMFIDIINDNFFCVGNKRLGINHGKIKVIYYDNNSGFPYNDCFPYFPRNINHDEIPLGSLSSAESNLVVLFYELIFELREKKIIMIDEPEISLHIYAQERILDIIDSLVNYDLESLNNYFIKNTGVSSKDSRFGQIIKDFVPLYGIQVLIATHSPNICKNHEDNMIELKSLQ